MTTPPRPTTLAALCVLALAAPAAAQTTVRHGAPGQPSRTVAASEAAAPAPARHTDADARFMQGMIPHHAQALDMSALVPTRSTRRAVLVLAQKIDAGQRDEIASMRRWLKDRGEEAPSEHAHHSAGHAASMPGMLSPEAMARLATTTGDAFDRLFLTSMIGHHEGALTMVTDLLAAPGAAQAPDVFRFASDIDADQRADIRRMRAILATLSPAPAPTSTPSPAPRHH